MHKDFNGGMVTHYIKTIIFYKFENEFYPINIHTLFEPLCVSIFMRAYDEIVF